MNQNDINETLVSDIHLAYYANDIEKLRLALQQASNKAGTIDNKIVLDEANKFFKWKAYHIHSTATLDVDFNMLDLMLEFGVDPLTIYYFPKMVSLAYLKAKTPTEALKSLPERRKAALPLALRIYFSSSSVTPQKYLLKCPDWHKLYVYKFI